MDRAQRLRCARSTCRPLPRRCLHLGREQGSRSKRWLTAWCGAPRRRPRAGRQSDCLAGLRGCLPFACLGHVGLRASRGPARGAARAISSRPGGSVPKCSLSKYGFRASGVRTGASADRAETGILPSFLRSVLKRPSQEVRRELASGERFPAVSASCQSTGPRRNPQETCHSARRLVRRRARLVWELAEGVHPDSNGRRPVAWRRASAANSVRAVTALPQAALADRASSRGRLGERRERHLRCAVQDLQQRLRGSRRQALALLPVPHRVQWHTDPCGKGSLR